MAEKAKIEVKRERDEVTVTVEIPREELVRAEDEAYRRMAKEFHVPGFRPGKVPKAVLLSRYGEDLFDDEVKEILVERWLSRVIEEHGLKPLSSPKVEILSFRRGEELRFKATFAVWPEVEIPDELDLEIPEAPSAEVSEEELAATLEDLKRRAAILEPKDGPAEVGDLVRFRHRDDLYEVEVTAEKEGLPHDLLGKRAGDTVLLEDEKGRKLAVEVTQVYKVTIPAEDEVAAHYGEESWEGLKERARAEIQRQKEAERKSRMRLAALDALAEKLGIEVPPSLLEEEVRIELARHGGKEELRGEVEEMVRRRMRRWIVSRLVASQKGLYPSDEEVRELARSLEVEEDLVRSRLILERAADWILEHARRAEEKEGK
ncbi:trigger factor [Candidatus Bipolaricaulota sp. J31]